MNSEAMIPMSIGYGVGVTYQHTNLTFYIPGTVLSVLYILIHLIDITLSQGRFCQYYCFHVIDKETEPKNLAVLPRYADGKLGIPESRVIILVTCAWI